MTDQNNQPDKQQLELKMREAILLQMRGDLVGSQKACIEVLKMEPNNVEALELMGDLMYARGDLEHAVIAYRQAKDNSAQGSPSFVSAERKWATLLYKQTLPELEQKSVGITPTVAAVLSLLLPGVAHIWIKQYIKAGIMMGCFFVIAALLVFTPWGLPQLEVNNAPATGPVVMACLLVILGLTAAIDSYQVISTDAVKTSKHPHPKLPEEVRNNPNAKP